MRRETTNILLVLVGSALIKITLDGTYLRYVKPAAQPLVLTAGMVVVLLALVAMVRDIATNSAPAGHDH
ncbi:MAG TPA: TIGR03943 family protein, partial [Pseudonocardiaceae bacterium]|nr:TIGR03943 family protein [Pseudonocardiaceae bacterium]